jgi:hypothetical protein
VVVASHRWVLSRYGKNVTFQADNKHEQFKIQKSSSNAKPAPASDSSFLELAMIPAFW